MIINEMFKHSVRFWGKISDISLALDDFININNIKERKDERRKWTKLCEIAEVLNLYRITKTKDYRFKDLDQLILLPQSKEKSNLVDEMIKLIINDTTSSLTLKIGSIIGNDTLLMSVHDWIKLQETFEGKERAFDVVKMYANVALTQKKFDLPKAFKKDQQIYLMLEKVIVDNMTEEFKSTANQSESETDEENITMLISSHQKLLASLDKSSESVKEYSLFLNLLDFAMERLAYDAEEKMTLAELVELYQRNELVEALFDKTKKVDRFDDLISELQNNIFMFSNRSQEYQVLRWAIKSLLKRWGKQKIDPLGENNGIYIFLFVFRSKIN